MCANVLMMLMIIMGQGLKKNFIMMKTERSRSLLTV